MMSEKHTLRTDPDAPQNYRVKLEGHLEQRWVDWFDGMEDHIRRVW